jgi:hypothetical protein
MKMFKQYRELTEREKVNSKNRTKLNPKQYTYIAEIIGSLDLSGPQRLAITEEFIEEFRKSNSKFGENEGKVFFKAVKMTPQVTRAYNGPYWSEETYKSNV